MRIMKWVSLAAGTMLALAAFAADKTPPVGMVLDINGKGEVTQVGEKKPIQVLAYLTPGSKLVLTGSAKVSISHYGAKLIYTITAPAEVSVDAGAIKVTKGADAVSKGINEKVVTAALSANIGQAAIKFRGLGQDITLATPSDKTALISDHPSFHWVAEEGASYQVTLTDDNDKVIAKGTVEGLTWDLPPSVKLARDTFYKWTVASKADEHSASARFKVASKSVVDTVQALRPAPDASVDEWVLYAAILGGNELNDDAKQVWRGIAVQRPDLEKAKLMAR